MTKQRGFIAPIGGAEEQVRNRTVLRRFVELCGGSDAKIAVIPTASRLPETGGRYEEVFKDLGAGRVRSLPFESRADCEREDWLRKIELADGVFMTGGNQLRLSTTLGGTPVADTIRRRNAEGLHVAGTSAGAAFVSQHMIVSGREGPTPTADKVNLAPGLGLTDKVIVDQHFRQRDRLGRLMAALSYNPRIIGLGVDEDTAAFIGPDDVVEVVGRHAVTVVDGSEVEHSTRASADEDEAVTVIGLRVHVLAAGATFDLGSRVARPELTHRHRARG